MAKREFVDPTRLLTITDIAERCDVSKRTVQRWITNKELNIHRLVT